MDALIMLVLLGVSAWLIATGARRLSRPRTFLGLGLLTASVALFGLARLWTEALWFQTSASNGGSGPS